MLGSIKYIVDLDPRRAKEFDSLEDAISFISKYKHYLREPYSVRVSHSIPEDED